MLPSSACHAGAGGEPVQRSCGVSTTDAVLARFLEPLAAEVHHDSIFLCDRSIIECQGLRLPDRRLLEAVLKRAEVGAFLCHGRVITRINV